MKQPAARPFRERRVRRPSWLRLGSLALFGMVPLLGRTLRREAPAAAAEPVEDTPPTAAPPLPASEPRQQPAAWRPVAVAFGLILAVLALALVVYRLADTNHELEIALLGLSLLLGFLVALFARLTCRIESDLILLFVIAAPFLLVLIATDRINVLKAPGGLEVGFAARVVEIGNHPAEISTQTVSLRSRLITLDQYDRTLATQAIAVSISLGRGDYYRDAFLADLLELAEIGNVRYAVFVDSNNRFVAYMPFPTLLDLLRSGERGDELVGVINRGQRLGLFRFPGVGQLAVVEVPTTGEALQTMIEHNQHELLVIDHRGRLRGIVARDQLLGELLMALISDDASEGN